MISIHPYLLQTTSSLCWVKRGDPSHLSACHLILLHGEGTLHTTNLSCFRGKMMRGITHADGVLPPWDWLMACSLSAESKETNWRRKWTRDGCLPAPAKPDLFYFISSCSCQHQLLCGWGADKRAAGLMPLRQGRAEVSTLARFSPSWMSRSRCKRPHGRRAMSSRCELGSPLPKSNHVHPQSMQLSSSLSARHYHNYISGLFRLLQLDTCGND